MELARESSPEEAEPLRAPVAILHQHAFAPIIVMNRTTMTDS